MGYWPFVCIFGWIETEKDTHAHARGEFETKLHGSNTLPGMMEFQNWKDLKGHIFQPPVSAQTAIGKVTIFGWGGYNKFILQK